jgi:hypothetical protein
VIFGKPVVWRIPVLTALQPRQFFVNGLLNRLAAAGEHGLLDKPVQTFQGGFVNGDSDFDLDM